MTTRLGLFPAWAAAVVGEPDIGAARSQLPYLFASPLLLRLSPPSSFCLSSPDGRFDARGLLLSAVLGFQFSILLNS